MPEGGRLVIFGCGYIGGEFARQALRRGWDVWAVTRNETTVAALSAMGVRAIAAELSGSAWHARLPDQVALALNAVSAGGGGTDGYRQSYVEGMRSILRWANASRDVGHIVYTSSTSVYPQSDGVTVNEDSPVDLVTKRPRLLVEAEQLLLAADGGASREVMRRTVLRLAGLYGPGRHAILDQVRTGTIRGFGEHRLNLIHRDDVCRAIWAAFERVDESAAVLNVSDDSPVRKQELAAWLAERVGMATPQFDGAVGARRAVLLDRVISNARIKARLGWQPRFPSYREGYENILSPPTD